MSASNADNHPFVVRISYKVGPPYHIFMESKDTANYLVNNIRDELNFSKKRIYEYINFANDYGNERTKILFSLEEIQAVVIMEKDPAISDMEWLG